MVYVAHTHFQSEIGSQSKGTHQHWFSNELRVEIYPTSAALQDSVVPHPQSHHSVTGEQTCSKYFSILNQLVAVLLLQPTHHDIIPPEWTFLPFVPALFPGVKSQICSFEQIQ